jgi:hypothetical protein
MERLQKQCTGCKTIKAISDFRLRLDKRSGKKYPNSTCRDCDAVAARKYRESVRGIEDIEIKNRERAKDYYYENIGIVREKAQARRQEESYKQNRKKYIQKNKEKIIAQEKVCKERYHQKNRDELTDVYVGSKITSKTGLSRNEIPQELIELKRAQLELQRSVKKIEYEGTGNYENA